MMKQFIPRPLKRVIKSGWLWYDMGVSVRLLSKLGPTEALLRRARRAWGNEGWSGDVSYLEAVCREAAATNRPILECGSGLTTILLGIFAAQRGITVISLEHIPEWEQRVNRTLERFNLPNRVLLAPLRVYDEFDWYELPQSLPKLGLVICDGPPSKTRGGRYGLLPLCRKCLAPTCTVLLDDATRKEEQAILLRWEEQFSVSFALPATNGRPFAYVQVP